MQTSGALETRLEPSMALPASSSSASDARHSRLVDYYELTKPRMNFLIVVTTMVGYYMACGPSAEGWRWLGLLHVLFGTALTASAAGVFNQYIERRYDRLMPRTMDRPLPAGRLTPGEAWRFGWVLGVGGVKVVGWCGVGRAGGGGGGCGGGAGGGARGGGGVSGCGLRLWRLRPGRR